MKILAGLMVAGGLMAAAGASHAAEADFLRSLDGNWSGKGTVKVRTNSSPINVSCTFDSNATESNVQDTLMGEEFVRTLTVPLPLQLPSSERRKSASAAWEAPVGHQSAGNH